MVRNSLKRVKSPVLRRVRPRQIVLRVNREKEGILQDREKLQNTLMITSVKLSVIMMKVKM